LASRLTRGQAIRLFCLECMGYTKHRSNGTRVSVTRGEASAEVRRCTDPECPLYRYRLGAEVKDAVPENLPKDEDALVLGG
jgi:hypothetical protein